MYIGNKPATDQTYLSLKSQQITGTGTATYGLTYDVSSPEDLAVFVNEIRQNPNTYSVDNQEITLGGTISASDTCYIVYLSRAVGSIAPQNNSIGTSKIIDGAVTYAKSSGFGKVAQVIQSTNTYTQSSTASSSVDILSASSTTWETSLTPSSTSSKILIMFSIAIRTAVSSASEARYQLKSHGKIGSGSYSNIWLTGNSSDVSLGCYDYGASGIQMGALQSSMYLWSPSTTDECKVKFSFDQKAASTLTVNRDNIGSSCTLMEILG